MPLTKLKTLDGREIPIGEVDISRTFEDFGLPPADVAAVINDASHGRSDVLRDQITASQAGSGARQLYLEETIDYAREPKRQMAALRGTMSHALVNITHPGLRVEQRVTSKSGRFSMKYDSYVEATGTLRDAKYPNVFKVLMILKHGVEAQAYDYVLQLNLGALLIREYGKPVNHLWLDFGPTGVGKLEKKELEEKYGITDPTFIPVAVPFLEEAVVWDAYERLHRAKAKAHKTGEVPEMCTAQQTWGGKKCTQGWCPVANECWQIAQQRGEAHPLDKVLAIAKAERADRLEIARAEVGS